MSTPKKTITKELETKIHNPENEEPCSAFRASLDHLVSNWLPKPETDCRKITSNHLDAFITCTVLENTNPSNGADEHHKHKAKACRRAYRIQNEAARCKVQWTLGLDQYPAHSLERIQNFARNPISQRTEGTVAKLKSGYFSLYSPIPSVRYFQQQYYTENPTEVSESMANALETSRQLWFRCMAYQAPVKKTGEARKKSRG